MAEQQTREADPRRRVPSTDAVLRDERLREAIDTVGRETVKAGIRAAQQQVRQGLLAPEGVVDVVLDGLPATPVTLTPVLNATGVLLHTNLGRAPLSTAAVRALELAAGTNDVELDLVSGQRGKRGRGALDALRSAVPDAEDVHIVNNGAAALALAATALGGERRNIVIARGEMVEIGDGFRLPDLLESTGARLREVGTTNRVHLDDYVRAIDAETAFVLKVHPSNFRITGFTSSVAVRDLAGLDCPLVVDIGSGLLARHPVLPDEPDMASTLRAGADLVTASGDKLLGGPQAGVIGGRAELVHRLRRHPLARAMRVDKLTLAAFEATLRGPQTPTAAALSADVAELRRRAETMADRLRSAGVDAVAADSAATVGGGGAPGVDLPSAAVSLPAAYADLLRAGRPAVLGRVLDGRCLLDLRTVRPSADDDLYRAILAAR
ncbi:L-seryl-tRNA(Sec) selenium transferase [Rhodococcus hoagii]|uniref:L-seryl-tRNA(Sec) selenium transferase n=2 Tax=Rhodococcus hoagii TaxID=43767 RepID=A0AAP2AJ53_RHOHA|nr:L-seryl-tRNA(Sec) selenium transferase [Prescottella equi]MBM4555545.1 L-seryl-tRNA(Sec) selenium transferase [Prescottella equi]MBM4625579.1 L-seryl-tRNA(Sec) selenium transferase [Prescottella equi]MBM4633781.1 L-seryl-tRNA(Sec) selenium transferase [Prescottella equi]MBM4725062.1 L-seryl-tRNA(Sec) selenium transferase [Prescottella equi]